MTISVKMVNDQIRKISETNTLLDMLLEFEKVLDDCDLYAYKNWIDGELVEGPKLGRHWISAKFMYPRSKMPDPAGAQRLLARQCLVKFNEDTLITPVKVKNFDDVTLEMRPDGTQRYKTKTKSEPVWVVEIRMPRKFVDEFATEVVEADEDSYVDTENMNAETDIQSQQMGTTGGL
jgi:hypothetical protein